jgi:hypothetical protein
VPVVDNGSGSPASPRAASVLLVAHPAGGHQLSTASACFCTALTLPPPSYHRPCCAPRRRGARGAADDDKIGIPCRLQDGFPPAGACSCSTAPPRAPRTCHGLELRDVLVLAPPRVDAPVVYLAVLSLDAVVLQVSSLSTAADVAHGVGLCNLLSAWKLVSRTRTQPFCSPSRPAPRRRGWPTDTAGSSRAEAVGRVRPSTLRACPQSPSANTALPSWPRTRTRRERRRRADAFPARGRAPPGSRTPGAARSCGILVCLRRGASPVAGARTGARRRRRHADTGRRRQGE